MEKKYTQNIIWYTTNYVTKDHVFSYDIVVTVAGL